jgi:hypothetical protein
LNLTDRHPARVQRENLVVESGEAALVLRDQARLERPLAVARHVDRERAVVGQYRLSARAVAIIGGVVRFRAAHRIPQVVRELATQRALDDRFLEATDGRVELLGRDPPPGERIDRESRTGPAPVARQAAPRVCGA